MKMTAMIERLRTRRRYQDNEAGQALVETAITIPFLFVFILGSVEMARVAYAAIEISNAARAAVQYGSQGVDFASDSAGMTATAQSDANDIFALNPSSFQVTPTITFICSDGNATITLSGDTAPTCASPTAVVEQILTVNTQANYDPLIHIKGMSTTFTLRGRAVQKVLPQ